jgi:hypothetical protein
MHEPHGQPVTMLGLWRHAEDAAALPDRDGERGRHA